MSEEVRSSIPQTMTTFSEYHSTVCFTLLSKPHSGSQDFRFSQICLRHHIKKYSRILKFYISYNPQTLK